MEKSNDSKPGQYIDVHFSKMDREDKKKYDKKIVHLLEIFKSVCDEHQIRWFLGYGACIGAVRHHGMIPWDEDIDIIVPRPDYDRFVEVCKKLKNVDCDILIRDDCSNFYEHFIRLSDKNSTLCISTDYNHVSGIYIEVAPLDGAGDGHVDWNYKRFRLWEVLSHFTRYNFTKEQKHRMLSNGKLLTYCLIQIAHVFRRELRPYSDRKLEQTLKKYSYNDSEYVLYYCPSNYFKRNLFKKEMLEETIEVPFENVTARIPKHYHEYLTQIYGDYMTPPPEEKRDEGHVFAFVDINKRYSLDEIKQIRSNNNQLVAEGKR